MSDKMKKNVLRIMTGCLVVLLVLSTVTVGAQTVPINENDWTLWETTDTIPPTRAMRE